MRDTYTSICQRSKSVPSRQQRDIVVPSLGIHTANQAEVSDDGSKTCYPYNKRIRVIYFIGLSLTMTQSK